MTNSKKNSTRAATAGDKPRAPATRTDLASSDTATSSRSAHAGLSKANALKAELAHSEDIAIVVGKSEDGTALQVLRKRADQVELGEVRPLEHGKPIQGEVVRLEQRGDTPLFDVKVQLSASELGKATLAGPAQVATDSYRKNWDTIWAHASKRDSDVSSDDTGFSAKRAASKKLLN